MSLLHYPAHILHYMFYCIKQNIQLVYPNDVRKREKHLVAKPGSLEQDGQISAAIIWTRQMKGESANYFLLSG